MEGYSTIEQVAAHYQVSISTVRAWIRRKIVPAIKVGGLYRLRFSELDAAFKQRTEESPAPAQTIEAIVPGAVIEKISPDQDI